MAFDSSDYRQATYGTPDYYCDPARALDSNGVGTLGNPWNLLQAMSEPVAGDVVGFLPGVGAVLTSTDDDNIATFRPARSGTLGNPIVYVTKYAAIALTNVDSNANRTQLRHNGTPEVATTAPGPETGSAIYGCYQTNYCTYDGFYVDMDSAEPKSDSGVIHEEAGTGNQFRNWVVKGKTTNMHSNAVIYRPQACTDSVVHNFRVTGFHNTGVGATQEGLFCDTYGSQNCLIEYGEYSDGDTGIYLKGTSSGIFNFGEIRYCKIFDIEQGMRFNDCDPDDLTTVHHNLIYNFATVGIMLSFETSDMRQLLLHHNTVANGAATGGGANGPLAINATADSPTNVVLRDNIFDWANASAGRAIEAGEHAEAMPTLNYNGYYRGGTTVQWSYNGDTSNGLIEWQSDSGQDAQSQVFSTDPFRDRANGDYRIKTSPAHAALIGSSTNGEQGAFEGGVTPGAYGSYDTTGRVPFRRA